MKIVVIGGSGLIGRQLTAILSRKGHNAIAASPSTGVNALTGEGLAEALSGADTVVDVANSPSFEDKAVLEFFERSGRSLLAAERQAGVKHHVALSIVGTIVEASASRGRRVVPDADFQPIAAADVAAALADVALAAPLNATIEIAGPERRPFRDFIGRRAAAAGDRREVLVDRAARYFGATLERGSLVPEQVAAARLGQTRFEAWMASA